MVWLDDTVGISLRGGTEFHMSQGKKAIFAKELDCIRSHCCSQLFLSPPCKMDILYVSKTLDLAIRLPAESELNWWMPHPTWHLKTIPRVCDFLSFCYKNRMCFLLGSLKLYKAVKLTTIDIYIHEQEINVCDCKSMKFWVVSILQYNLVKAK